MSMNSTDSFGVLAEGNKPEHCCASRSYFENLDNLVNTLHIVPRVLIWKKSLKIYESYEQELQITNRGIHPRSLKYYTDSKIDTFLAIPKSEKYKYLNFDETIIVKILIQPKHKDNINRRRCIIIESEHPNLKIEVPIIVVNKESDISLPTNIVFSASVLFSPTFYEFSIYNPHSQNEAFYIKNQDSNISIIVSDTTIQKHDYKRVLLCLKVKDTMPVENAIRIRIGHGVFIKLNYHHIPLQYAFYLSCTYFKFNTQKFNRKEKQSFTICNSGTRHIDFSFEFITTEKSLQKYSEDDGLLRYYSADDKISLLSIKTLTNESVDSVETSINDQKHFIIKKKFGQLKPHTSQVIDVIFKPVIPDYDDEDHLLSEDSIGLIDVHAIIKCAINPDSMNLSKTIVIAGSISGPDVEFEPMAIDFGKVYVGEQICAKIDVVNVDDFVKAKISFKEFPNAGLGVMTISPLHLEIDPCQYGTFHLKYFATVPGQYNIPARFKVMFGNFYEIPIEWFSYNVSLTTHPEFLELGSIPIAIPQKRFFVLINPLSVPLSFQCMPSDDGLEVPLVLPIEADNVLPITIKNPARFLLQLNAEPKDNTSEHEAQMLDDDIESLVSFQSDISDDSSEVSSRFITEVLEYIPEKSKQVLKMLRLKRITEKGEPDKKVMQDVLDSLLGLNYFKDMIDYRNYGCMDWNAIPSDPQELFITNEIICLNPNSSKIIAVLVIPNVTGYQNRSIKIRVCPDPKCQDLEKTNSPVFVNSTFMTSKFSIEYTCCLPVITWNTPIEFKKNHTIYVGQEINFDFEFINESDIAGFVYFDVIPNSALGKLSFPGGNWKFYMVALEVIKVNCMVVFRKIGEITLPGLIKVVGNTVSQQFEIKATVLPTRVAFHPSLIYRRQKVLEFTRTYVYIENITPSVNWLYFSLKCNKHQKLEPLGAILGPNGHGIYLTIYSMFYDPDIYKNILYVNMPYGISFEIPIKFNVEDVPMHFHPNISEGVTFTEIITNSEENFNAYIPNFSKTIEIKNNGKRSYRMIISRLKNNNEICTIVPVKTRILFSPKSLFLEPGQIGYLTITANSYVETTIYNQFRVQIIDLNNLQRFKSMTFTLTATFVEPEVHWNRKEVCIDYYKTHKIINHLNLELLQLINPTKVTIDNVYLKVLGPFRIKQLYEQMFSKELTLTFEPLERKEFTVVANESPINKDLCNQIKGRILCTANYKVQKSLPLCVRIFNPEIEIFEPILIRFTDINEHTINVPIENHGCVTAEYKWKKIEENIEYIDEFEVADEYAYDILSDIFRMLDLSDEEIDEANAINNLTLRYEKLRCIIKPPEDNVNVEGLLNDVINNLDLEHKRYMLKLSDSNEFGPALSESPKNVINQIINNMFNSLNLEESYEVSEPSLEDCDKDRYIYFYKKAGNLAAETKDDCALHLPGVRLGYKHQATFQLDIVGGVTQMFHITLINLRKTMELCSDNIYLGIKPWYEQYNKSCEAKNITDFLIKLSIREKREPGKKLHRLIDGYVEIAGDNTKIVLNRCTEKLKLTGIMGFSDVFIRELIITMNNGEECFIRLRGQGIMPILSMLTKLKPQERPVKDTLDEYRLLQRIYYMDAFKGITEEDEPESATGEEAGKQETQSLISWSSSSEMSASDSIYDRSSRMIIRDKKFFFLMRSYVIINNNDELPNALILKQYQETERFLELLRENEELRYYLNLVYQEYQKHKKPFDENLPINLKNFNIQPLPFEIEGGIFVLNNLKMNEYRKYEIFLQFFGPGKLTAACRTVIKIPNLVVDFLVIESEEKFLYYSLPERSQELSDKRYLNMKEREIDEDINPKVKHAHSFDISTVKKKHLRDISIKDRKYIQYYYNSLKRSVYLQQKHHFPLCKVYSCSKSNLSNVKLRLKILLKPTPKFYKVGQLFEDYLFIDLHMGPTLPILLRGIIDS